MIDRAVGIAPIYGESQPLPQCLVVFLFLSAYFQALFNERGAPNFGSGDMQALLHQTFGGQTVVVEAHRVEDVIVIHTPETCYKIGMAIRIDMTQVQVARNGCWRRVD